MKIKVSRSLIPIIILITLFIGGILFIFHELDNELPTFSVTNKSALGCSVFYDTLKELKYPIYRTLEDVGSVGINNIQIVANGGNFDISSDSLKSWIARGGIFIFLASDTNQIMDYAGSPKVQGNLSVYHYKKGMIIYANGLDITNKIIMEDTSYGYELLKEIDSLSYKKIYFNEANLFLPINSKSLWDYTPLWVKIIIYQILLVIISIFYYMGKRFGKPIVLYEEVERRENEYLYSAAMLYRHANCWDIILVNYYNNLLRAVNSSRDDWIKYWKREGLPHFDKAVVVYEFMNNPKGKKHNKDYIQMINSIELLNKVLKKRRDLDWKNREISQ